MIVDILLGLLISYLVLFILSLILKDNSIADVFWGLGFLQIYIHSSILAQELTPSRILLGILIVAWSLRLSSHILSKKIHKPGEDSRYVRWRKSWKYFYLRSFFQVYIFQGALLFIIAIPIMLINSQATSASTPSHIGAVIALSGLIFESIADLQLKRFIQQGKGGIMTSGLWYYSRHPNYFGESVFWLGITVMALPLAWWAVVSWLLITFLLRFVSGVPLAEIRYAKNKEYQDYAKTTPAMIPNFFKS